MDQEPYDIVLLAKFAAKKQVTIFQLIEYWNFFDEDAPASVVRAYDAFFAEYVRMMELEKGPQ
jgi:hypothetical protein